MLNDSSRRSGFTILEVMVALTITLIMMGALAQAFKYLGNRIQMGRAEVELSGKTRATAVRLRDELRRVTAGVNQLPPLKSPAQGYFMYYEGPMSDASTAIYGLNEADDRGAAIFRDSRFGDFDDYLAFTVQAPAGSWFTGKVPRFVLDPDNNRLPGFGTGADWLEPVEITSKYAEVVYWASPEWVRDPATGGLVYSTSEVPMFVDNDGTQELDGDGDSNDNGIPDRLVLRRRVLLIRPDLVPSAAGTSALLPAPKPGVYSGVPSGTNHQWWMTDPYQAAGWATDLSQAFNSNWLNGMQLAYQLCDLSLGRRMNTDSSSTSYGLPLDPNTYGVSSVGDTSVIQMNSLNDLMRAENRFAHVRAPGGYFGNTHMSMPLLALTGSNGFFASTISTRSHNAYPMTNFTGVTGTNVAPIFNGFVLPHFELSNAAAIALSDMRWDRTGEDVVATNVLSFDVQVYDPEASVLLTNGPDAEPGAANVDDDSNGTVDDVTEQGTTASDDVLVTPDDPSYFAALLEGRLALAGAPYTVGNAKGPNASFSTLGTAPDTRATVADRGAFVDLGYAVHPANPLRDLFDQLSSAAAVNVFHNIADTYLRTPMSGYDFDTTITPYNSIKPNMYQASMLLSGRTVFSTTPANPTLLFHQMVYDSGTNAYESDGFDQTHLTQYSNTSVTPNRFTPYGTWWTVGSTTLSTADEATNGIDDPKTVYPGVTIPGVDDPSENETSPPIAAPLKAVRVRIRLEDPATRQFKQIAVVHDFPE